MENHLKNLVDFQLRHKKAKNVYNRQRKPDRHLKQEMENIRHTCKMYLQTNNLLPLLVSGGSTPQHQAEYNDFDSISDFDEIIEGIITKLKSNKQRT